MVHCHPSARTLQLITVPRHRTSFQVRKITGAVWSLAATAHMRKEQKYIHLLDYMDPDCIMMTETKIDNTVSSAEFMPPNYTCYHKDRKKGGGGVLVARKSSYPSVEVELNDIDGEIVWATVTLRNQKALYI